MTKASKQISSPSISSNLFFYALTHAFVDCLCAFLVRGVAFMLVDDFDSVLAFVLLYNVLAFGLQPLIGLLSDHYRAPRFCALLGCALLFVAAGSFLFAPVWLTIIFAGLGNAAFHAGAGSWILRLSAARTASKKLSFLTGAGPIGVFVAPGVLGLFLGSFLAQQLSLYFLSALLLLLLILSLILLFLPPSNKILTSVPTTTAIPGSFSVPKFTFRQRNFFSSHLNTSSTLTTPITTLKISLPIVFSFICLSIVIRAFVGSMLKFTWQSTLSYQICWVLAIFFGKAFGGYLADRYGWLKMSIASLLLAIPCLFFQPATIFWPCLGIFLFNLSMAVASTLLAKLLPQQTGFAFGLTCLALIIGTLPTLFGQNFANNYLLIALILLSAFVLFLVLKMLELTLVKNYQSSAKNN